LCIKSQIPSTKLQTNLKFQTSSLRDVNIINVKAAYHKFIKNQVVKAKGMMDKTPW